MADLSKTVWMLADLATGNVTTYASEDALRGAYEELTGRQQLPTWLTLMEAWERGQQELGFAFTRDNVKKYVASYAPKKKE